MDPQFKKQVALSDALMNLDDLPVVSPKLKAFIEGLGAPKLEFLPVEIRDHKGKPVKEQYHVMNPLAVVDCLDRDQSDVMWNALSPDVIAGVNKLVLRLDAIDPELAFFRVKHLYGRVLVNADVADKLNEEDFSALYLMELEDFSG